MVKRRYPLLMVITALVIAPFFPSNSSSVQAKTTHKVVYRYTVRRNIHAVSNRIQLPVGTEKSSNWAGYAVTAVDHSSPYHLVSGSWTVPIAYGTSGALGAQWIGLGGYSSSDLLQLGTIEEMSGKREVVTLFWEKLPATAQNIGTVPVGSRISTSISQNNNGTWALHFSITTPKRQRITKTVTVSVDTAYVQGMGTSAEWISEDPSDGSGNLYPLANTGTVQYTNVSANSTSVTAAANRIHPLAVASSASRLLLVPSNLSNGGTAFNTKNAMQQSMTFMRGLPRHRFRISHHSFRVRR